MWRLGQPSLSLDAGPPRVRADFLLLFPASHCMQVDESDVSTCRYLQLEEMEVVEVPPPDVLTRLLSADLSTQSIYPDYFTRTSGQDVNILEVPVQLSKSHTLILYKEETSLAPDVADAPALACADLTTLPPVLLNIYLPESYPIHKPPQILSIHTTHSWLPAIRTLQDKLIAMWTPQEGVLYNWIEYIESGRFLIELGFLHNASTIIRCVSRLVSLFVLTSNQVTSPGSIYPFTLPSQP
jgi:hypothetical protein